MPKNTKKCSQCEKVLDLAEFNKDGSKHDGLCRMCKKCTRQYRKAMRSRKSDGSSYADSILNELGGGEM